AGDVVAMKREIDALVKITTDENDDWFDEYEDDEKVMPRAKRMHELLPVTAGHRLQELAQTQTDPKRKKALLTAAVTELTSQTSKVKDDKKLVALRNSIFQTLIE